jgi:hypothetical protein
MADPWEVPELEVRERSPSTLRNVDDGFPGGAGAEDPGAPLSMLRNIDDGPPGGAEAGGLGTPTINAKKRR